MDAPAGHFMLAHVAVLSRSRDVRLHAGVLTDLTQRQHENGSAAKQHMGCKEVLMDFHELLGRDLLEFEGNAQ